MLGIKAKLLVCFFVYGTGGVALILLGMNAPPSISWSWKLFILVVGSGCCVFALVTAVLMGFGVVRSKKITQKIKRRQQC